MRRILSILSVATLLLLFRNSNAQSLSVTLTGRILESKSSLPVEFATILVKSKADDHMIIGTTTNSEGRFEMQSSSIDVYIEVSFVGYITQIINAPKPIEGQAKLEDILLEEDSKTLADVVVEGEKSQTEFRLDKRVFNVGQDLRSAGASALEVLNHVPSVNVSIEGQISLRGSQGVRILINGKPSVLASEQGNALGTITADMIERIEVITNPSAKYDAEGTAGIINIVLKKEDKDGINGAVTLNTGVPNNHSLGFSMNRRTEKLNLFTQLGIGHRTFPQQSKTINRNDEDGETIRSEGDREKNETFYNLILGTDYHFNRNNMISLTGYWAYEKETEYGTIDFNSLNGAGVSLSEWRRSESTSAGNPKWQYDLQYQKNFSDNEEHQLLITAVGNFFGKDQNSNYTHQLISGADPGVEDQRTETAFDEAEYTFKADYTWPITKKWTLESGLQYLINEVSNDYSVSDWIENDWRVDPNLTNIFEMDQHVSAGYAIGAYEGDKLGVKFGLRVENTNLETVLISTNEFNDQQYLSFFPSAYTSYKFNKKFSVQTGYSRRIFRPGLWELNPFYNMQNNYVIETGNPELQPEFTDVVEATSILNLSAISLNFGVYHHNTTDAIEDITTIEDNVSITRPVNAGTRRTTGLEFNAKWNPLDWLSFASDVNFNYVARDGSVNTYSFDFTTKQLDANLTTKFTLPADFDFEITGNYSAPYETIQGDMSEIVSADIGVRKKIVKGKLILNLSVRDVFASSVWESELEQSGYYLYEWYKMGRFVTFGISYGFGKGEAMEFSGQKMF